MQTVSFSIAGLGFRFQLAPGISRNFRHGYPLFEVDQALNGSTDYRIVDRVDFEQPPPVGELIWDSFRWQLGRTADDRYSFNFRPPHRDDYETIALTTPDFESAVFTPASVSADIDYECPLRWPVDEQVMLNRCALHGAGLIHASAVVHGGKILMFCGKSGAGKSTTVEIWKRNGHVALNDDRIIVRRLDGASVAASTPWHGSIPEIIPAMLPLGGIYHLTQAPENSLRKMDCQEGLTRLIANAIAPFYLEASMERLLEAFAVITEDVPSYELCFTPDDRAMQCVLGVQG